MGLVGLEVLLLAVSGAVGDGLAFGALGDGLAEGGDLAALGALQRRVFGAEVLGGFVEGREDFGVVVEVGRVGDEPGRVLDGVVEHEGRVFELALLRVVELETEAGAMEGVRAAAVLGRPDLLGLSLIHI